MVSWKIIIVLFRDTHQARSDYQKINSYLLIIFVTAFDLVFFRFNIAVGYFVVSSRSGEVIFRLWLHYNCTWTTSLTLGWFANHDIHDPWLKSFWKLTHVFKLIPFWSSARQHFINWKVDSFECFPQTLSTDTMFSRNMNLPLLSMFNEIVIQCRTRNGGDAEWRGGF